MTTVHPCTLLVIDPCPDTQAQILDHVQGRDFSVITAADPRAALSTIDLTAPDIVITDAFLPEGHGLMLAKTLRARQDGCPVIVLTRQPSNAAAVEALRAGAVDYLQKPIGVEELAHALQRARQATRANIAHLPGLQHCEYRLTIDSNPSHVPGIVSWLIKTTAGSLSEVQRLHLRGTLSELLFNAIEHGNLEIFYQEKSRAILDNRYDELLAQRLSTPRLKDRTVAITVRYDGPAQTLEYRIADQGKGFKWQGLLNRTDADTNHREANGRGIFLARSLFPNLTYNVAGNEACIKVPLGWNVPSKRDLFWRGP